jgi:hypothetical protein
LRHFPHCWNYFGTHDLWVKRSNWALDKEAGWAIVAAAATKIGGAYDWKFILKLAADRLLVGKDWCMITVEKSLQTPMCAQASIRPRTLTSRT